MALLNAERSQERLECTAAAGANLELREHQARVAEARTLMEQARNQYAEGSHEAARQTLNQATEKLYDAAREQQNLALQVRVQARSIADCAVPDYDEDFTDENLEEELADEEVE